MKIKKSKIKKPTEAIVIDMSGRAIPISLAIQRAERKLSLLDRDMREIRISDRDAEQKLRAELNKNIKDTVALESQRRPAEHVWNVTVVYALMVTAHTRIHAEQLATECSKISTVPPDSTTADVIYDIKECPKNLRQRIPYGAHAKDNRTIADRVGVQNLNIPDDPSGGDVEVDRRLGD